jgi:four helix bundle protein
LNRGDDLIGINSFKDLKVWQVAMDLAACCYELTSVFPKSEIYGLTSQIRRSAASVPANIAEGHGRDGTGNFVQHLKYAQGSLKELETHLILAVRVGIANGSQIEKAEVMCDEVGRMLRSLIRSLQENPR